MPNKPKGAAIPLLSLYTWVSTDYVGIAHANATQIPTPTPPISTPTPPSYIAALTLQRRVSRVQPECKPPYGKTAV